MNVKDLTIVPFRLHTFYFLCSPCWPNSTEIDGGIADRPHDMADVFHTFFGISGLSLLGYFKDGGGQTERVYREIDPLYALPVDVVQRLNLKGQVISQTSTLKDERLAKYDVLTRQRSVEQ